MSSASPAVTRRWGDLGVRAVSALVMIAVAVTTARQGGPLFLLLWFAASLAVFWEWQRLVGGAWLAVRLVGGAGVLVVLAALVSHLYLDWSIAVLIAATAVLAQASGPGKRLWAGGGVLYAGLLMISVVALRESFPFGARSIIWLFATVWATDCFAYFGGRLIGGPKLWPRISPSKTWSGTVSGVVAGGLIGTFVAVRDLPQPWQFWPILALTFSAAALSQAGDAFESAIKRHFGVKDSSRLIPGHGGVMDRLDGFIAAAVFAFTIGMIRNVPTVAGGLFYWS